MEFEDGRRLSSAGHAGCEYDHFGGVVLLAAPMCSLLIGAFLAHVSSRFCPSLPYTPALALIGIIVAVIAMQQAECSHMRGSVERWVQLDGHALLFIFLPPLLFADTMHMDWALFKVSLGQCMLLASTGVLLGALLTALYAMALPYGWDFGLALGFGAVQAATDPVAVVSLLASLGAPATLTMIISGESLLNDGSAIVVWNVAFYSYLGQGRNVFLYTIQLVFGGLLVGLVFWVIILAWMSLLNRKHGHTDSVVQVGLTIFAAYTCFYVCEAVCGVSGVLGVVTMGVGLSATFWPMVCSRETMEHVWHIFEWILNTFLFQLAGIIIGAVRPEPRSSRLCCLACFRRQGYPPPLSLLPCTTSLGAVVLAAAGLPHGLRGVGVAHWWPVAARRRRRGRAGKHWRWTGKHWRHRRRGRWVRERRWPRPDALERGQQCRPRRR